MLDTVMSNNESEILFEQTSDKPTTSDTKLQNMGIPLKCPLTRCNEIVASSTIFSHFIIHHQRDPDDIVEFQNAHEGEKITLMVFEGYFGFGQNICLGLLTYLPHYGTGDSQRSHSNAMLASSHDHYEHHLPIMIMACKTNLKNIRREHKDADDIIVFWLSTVHHKTSIYATFTIYNDQQTKSISR